MKVSLNKLEPLSYDTARGDHQKGARYNVLIDGVVIGQVSKHSEESWLKSGRIKTTMIGYSRWWEADLEARVNDVVIPWSQRRVGHQFQTREDAIAAIVEAYAKFHPEVK
jgi:hypothetical protein